MVKDNSFYNGYARALIIIFLMVSAFFVSAQDTSKLDKKLDEVQSLLEQEKFDKALVILNKLIKRTDDSDYKTQLLYARAFAYYGMNNLQNSLADVNQVLTDHPDFQEARLLRAELYNLTQDYQKGIADLSVLIDAHADISLINNRVSMALDAGDYALACQDIKTMLMYNPTPDAETYLGYVYYLSDDLDSAQLCLDSTIEKYPDHADAYFYAGIVALEKGEKDQAVQYFNKGLTLAPEHAYMQLYKGISLVEEEDTNEEGCRCLNKAFYQGMDDAADYLKEYCFGKP
jgi:tetratricopeptide (TPR) repeat protein